jgi:hypothetical protein
VVDSADKPSCYRMRWKTIKDFLRIVVICCMWYVVSTANGVIGKWILNVFPHPMTITLCQLLSISLYTPPLLVLLSIRYVENSLYLLSYYPDITLSLMYHFSGP